MFFFLFFFSFVLIFFWTKRLSSRVSNSAKHRLCGLALLRLFLVVVVGHPAAEAYQLVGPCSLVGPMCEIRAYIWRVGDWKGLERCLRVGGYKVRHGELRLNFILITLSSPLLGLPRPMPGGVRYKTQAWQLHPWQQQQQQREQQLVDCTGNPWVFLTVPVPVPAKTCTHATGTGNLAG
jgi:hypothetical protein